MAKQGATSGVSLRSKDAVQTGLFAGGQCTLAFEFGIFDYGKMGKHPALIVTAEDENGEKHEEPYGLGKGWDISRDGKRLIPKNGQTGLPNSCDTILYMMGPLEEALEAAGIAMPDMSDGDVSELDGVVAVLARKPVQERDFGDNRKRDESRGPKTKLVVTEVVSAPWADEAPAKGKGAASAKAASKPNGKAAAADADDDADDELDALAQEALIEALEENNGPLDADDIEAAVLKQLKGNPQRKAIAARAAMPAFLASDDREGISYNSKKGTVAAD